MEEAAITVLLDSPPSLVMAAGGDAWVLNLAAHNGATLEDALRTGVAARLADEETSALLKAHDSGFEPGLSTDDLREYFLLGRPGGVLVFRRKDDGAWSAQIGKTLMPAVLTADSVERGLMPPPGVSGLPASLERVVPIRFRYWAKQGGEAVAVRNAFVESGFMAERALKVVDGEIRLTVERVFLYEPDGEDNAAPLAGATQPPPVAAEHRWKAAGGKPREFAGLKLRIDRPVGFVQTGKDADGTEWSRTYTHDYGYLPRTKGGDGMALDVFLGPNEAAPSTFWVHQVKADGTFDEYKVMAGFSSAGAAKAAYLAHVPERHFGGMRAVPIAFVRALSNSEPMTAAVETLGTDASGVDALLAAEQAVEKRVVSVLKAEEEQRFVLGIVLEPEVIDAQKDIYSAAEVRMVAHKFMEQYRTVGLMHRKAVTDKVKILESYIAPADFDLEGSTVKAGTWLMAMRVVDDELWSAVKAGNLTGFSIGGSAIRKPDPAAHRAEQAEENPTPAPPD